MARRQTRRKLIRSIRKLNTRFRKLRNQKQSLLEKLWATCFHTQAFETGGTDGGPLSIPGGPARFCPACGYEEQPTPVKKLYRKLLHSDILPTRDHNDYVAWRTRLEKSLGINL